MRRRTSFAFAGILLLATQWSTARSQPAVPGAPIGAGAPSLAWQVEARFRLWDTAQTSPDGSDVDELLQGVASTRDPAQVYADLQAFLRDHARLFKSGHWNATTQQYELSYLYPPSYAVSIGFADPSPFIGRSCHWTTSAGAIDNPDVPCANSARIVLPADGANDGKSTTATVSVEVVGSNPSVAAQQTVQVRDRLIVSMGDSFASGEGNPDQPSDLEALRNGPGIEWTDDWIERWLGRDAMQGVGGAAWWDTACHRSFMSQHVIAAVKYAADRPHEAVTFLSYACSGAAVFDGLLAPQSQPPGYQDNTAVPTETMAQVDALVRNLCPPNTDGSSTGQAAGIRTYQQGGIFGFGGTTLKAPIYRCAGQSGRPVDAVLLVIGGNDIGFSPVIMDAMLPKQAQSPIGNLVLTAVRLKLTRTPLQATTAIQNQLPENLHALDQQLAKVVNGAVIIQSSYPSPIRDETGWFCGPPDKTAPSAGSDPSLARLVAVNGVWPDAGIPPQLRWKMIIDQNDGKTVEPIVVTALNDAIEYHGRLAGWAVADDYLNAFQPHGWCAKGSTDEDASLPEWSNAGAAWDTWNPATWDPYAPRARYFRTPNDAALTEIQDAPRPNPLYQVILDIRQIALLNSLDGAFHPTFQAHVIMGLSVDQALESRLAP